MQKRMKRTYIIHFSNHFVMTQIFFSKEELGGPKVRQLWFQFSPPLFNKAVKNDVENVLVTKVITRQSAIFYALHWIGCEYELLIKFLWMLAAGTPRRDASERIFSFA